MTVLATVTDPQGRPVDLTDTQWQHIVNRRGQLARLQDVILRAVEAPDVIHQGHESNELWFYLEHAGPSRWLRVVVAYEGGRGFIVTAFPRRKRP